MYAVLLKLFVLQHQVELPYGCTCWRNGVQFGFI